MNKKLFIVALILVVSCAGAFSLGVGAQFGYNPSYDNSASLTFKVDSAPWVFAADLGGIGGDYFTFGLTADMWLANKKFAAPLAYYYGWGLGGAVGFYDDAASIFLGARALAGLNIFLLDGFLEFYLQAALMPGIAIWTGEGSNLDFEVGHFPLNFGFRFWI